MTDPDGSRNPETADLDFQCEIVDKQWQVFKQHMEEEQQAELEKRSKFHLKKRPVKQLAVEGKQRPTATDVIEAVKDAEQVWKEKERIGQGRVQNTFHAFCRVLDRHKSMLEMLPSQNEYFSILCGAITTLINVSGSGRFEPSSLLTSGIGVLKSPEDCKGSWQSTYGHHK